MKNAVPKRAAPPPLNALRAFEAFARHGGMTAAASELCVTHGAVSRQVRALQEALGVVLVTGPRHRLALTPAGAALAQQLSAGFDLINDAVAAARAREHHEIEISCLGTLSMKWLIPRLPEFLSAHPDIRVRLSEAHGPVDFARDRFDGAIRILNPGETAGRAETTPFMVQHQGPVVAPHLAKVGTGAGIDLDSLFSLPRLHASTFRDSWRLWAELTGHDLAPGPVEREFGHNHSMIEAAVSGMGVAIAPWAFVAPDIQSGRLAAPFGFAQRPSHFVFLQPVGRKDPAVGAFCDWLVTQGAETPPPPMAGTGYSLDRS